jgi:hypothetical protein
MKKYPAVEVRWDDAYQDDGDIDEKTLDATIKAKKLMIARRQHTLGFLVKRTVAGVLIATEHGTDPETGEIEFRTVNFIPDGMIVSIKKLR